VSAILKVMMARPDLFRLGYYQIATGSGRNYDTILGTLELIASQAGRVNGIPFKLRLVKEPTIYNEDGTRKQTEKWFLQLEPEPEFTRKLYRRQAAAILDEPAPRPQLEPGDWDGEFDADSEAPPPIAENGGPATVDAETGEILEPEPTEANNDNGSEPAAWTDEAKKVVVKVVDAIANIKQATNLLKMSSALDPNDAPDIIAEWALAVNNAASAGDDSDTAVQKADAAIRLVQFAKEAGAEVKEEQEALL
jgi:hypothetical protein